MTSFGERFGQLVKAAAGCPPRTIYAEALRARARRQQKRIRFAMAAAVAVVGAAIAIPLTVGASHGRALTVVSGGSSASVTASPSEQLHNGQTVRISIKGFPAGHKVTLAECPSVRVPPSVPCGRVPAQAVLTPDARGSATGRFTVEYAPAALSHLFSQPKCGPVCLLVATSAATPPVSATAALSFASVSLPQGPPPPTRFAEPSGFGVTAASFITANRGWALGSTGCPGCAGIATTRDGGKTWSYLPAPPASLYWYYRDPSAVSNIDFANSSDGYLFGPGLYATSDGGHTWTDQHLTDIKSLTIAGGYAYALSGHSNGPETLYRSQVGTNNWQKVALPARHGQGRVFKTAAAGADLVLLQTGSGSVSITPGQVGRLWVSTDAGKVWQPRRMPCTVADGGATLLSVARGHPQSWLIVCFNNRQSSQAQNTEQHLYGTANGGNSWVRLANPPQHNDPALLADNGSGHAFLATDGGRDSLNGTLDGGRTWHTSIRDGGSFSGWADLRFVDTNTGYVVGPFRAGAGLGTPHLYRTTDGGRTWNITSVTP